MLLSDGELAAEVTKIKGNLSLYHPPLPRLPIFPKNMQTVKKIAAIQQFIYLFEYNYTDQNYFNVLKNRSYLSLMTTAKEIIREALPIKCMEAVILALYMTNEFSPQLTRIPVRFKSTFDGHTYRHIILALCYDGRFGAVGLSRKCTLEFKPFHFISLSSLVADYCRCYLEIGHLVCRISCGLPVELGELSTERVWWSFLYCHPGPSATDREWQCIWRTVDRFLAESDRLLLSVRTRMFLRPIENCLVRGYRLHMITSSSVQNNIIEHAADSQRGAVSLGIATHRKFMRSIPGVPAQSPNTNQNITSSLTMFGSMSDSNVQGSYLEHDEDQTSDDDKVLEDIEAHRSSQSVSISSVANTSIPLSSPTVSRSYKPIPDLTMESRSGTKVCNQRSMFGV